MPRKIKIEGTVISENEYYKVIKPFNEEVFSSLCIIAKEIKGKDKKVLIEEGYWTNLTNYKILGSALITEINGTKIYWNEMNWQLIGRGAHRCHTIELVDWKTKNVNGKEITSVVYYDDFGRKYMRYIDENGDFYKKQKKQVKQLQNNDDLSV